MSGLLLWLSLGLAQPQSQSPPELEPFSSEKEAVESKSCFGFGVQGSAQKKLRHGHGWMYAIWIKVFDLGRCDKRCELLPSIQPKASVLWRTCLPGLPSATG